MHLPVTTPFFPDGRLNLRKLEQNVEHYSLTPAAGMLVLGPGGEASLLSDDETTETLKAAIGAASTTKVMLAGVSRDSVSNTLESIESAARLGYDAVTLEEPSLRDIAAKEVRLYFQTVADRSALPIVLAGALPLDAVADLALHPQIVGLFRRFAGAGEIQSLLDRTAGVKRTVTVTQIFAAVTRRMHAAKMPDGAGAFVSAESLTGGGTAIAAAPAKVAPKTRTKVVGFQILVGGTERMLDGLTAGAVGALPLLAAAAPQACYEVLAAWKDGDPALAAEKQVRLVEAARQLEEVFGVAGLKYGCDLNGYFGGMPRLPRLPLLGAEKAEVGRVMLELRS